MNDLHAFNSTECVLCILMCCHVHWDKLQLQTDSDAMQDFSMTCFCISANKVQ